MRSARELGRRQVVTFRNKHDGFPSWGGMSLQGDPGGLPPNVFRHLRNGRPAGGNWSRRGGQELLNSTSVDDDDDAYFRWLTDVTTDPYRLYVAGGGCLSATTTGFSVRWFDPDQEPRLQQGAWYETIEDIAMGEFDDQLYLGLSDTSPARTSDLRRFHVLPQAWGTNMGNLAGLKQEYPLYTFALRTIDWLFSFDGKLFISLDDGTTGGAADNRIAVYNGLSMYDGSTAAMPADRSGMDFPVSCMGRVRDFLVMGYAAGANMISVREPGDPAGTYHDIAPAAGTIVTNRQAEYKNKGYFFPGGSGANATNIWVYDDADPATFLPASLTVARNILNSEIRCGAAFRGYLYYGWRRTTDGAIIIGRYDGTTWTDTYKILSTQGAANGSSPATIARIDDLVSYRGSLHAIVFCNGQASPLVDEGMYLVYSKGADVAGTWEIQNEHFAGGTDPNTRILLISPATGGVARSAVVH